jgi:hypothetical protein
MGRSAARFSGSWHSRVLHWSSFINSPSRQWGVVLHSPLLASNVVERRRSERPAEQIVPDFCRALFRLFTLPRRLADGLQAWPLVLLLKPDDPGGQRQGGHFHACSMLA